MCKVLVLYYSSYGHVEVLAKAQADGAARVSGAQVTLKRVPEIMPPEIAAAAGFPLDQTAPVAAPDELAQYDAILFGTPTRFGNIKAQEDAGIDIITDGEMRRESYSNRFARRLNPISTAPHYARSPASPSCWA
jgi:multimeric flavodoxin WrbA